MKHTNKLLQSSFLAGWSLFLVFVLLTSLAAQTGSEMEELEKIKAQITKAPVQLQLPPTLAKAVSAIPARKIAAPMGGLVTIMSEDFEADFPRDLWKVNTGDYTWAKRNCTAHGGAFSAWAVGGGTGGGALACGGNYPNSVSTAMIYGPFDLSDASYAAFSFWVLLNSETNYDFFAFLTSEDGTNFSGIRLSGTTNNAWVPFTQALTAVPSGSGAFKNLTGKSAVWFAFAFTSDGSSNNPIGALVDDVVLQKGMVNVPTVVSSFSSPGPSPRGLAFDGTNLFCSDATNDRIYKLTTTGSTVSSFASPGPTSTGLAWDGANLWNADLNNEKIYKFAAAGTVLSSFSTPGHFPTGLAWHGSGFWLCDSDVPTLWKLNASGSVLSSFSATGTFHYGLAWDGQNLWLADGETLLIYKMDASGNVLDYYLAPGTNQTGLVWDGDNLWAADRNTRLIYKLQVQQFSNDVGANAIDLPGPIFASNAVTVKVAVKNFGILPQSNFPISYRIDNGPVVTENFAATLAAGASTTKIFATTWRPSTEATYRFSTWTALVGDQSVANDTLSQLISVVKPGRLFKWTAQTSGTAADLNSVYFNNASTGWAVGDSGTILKTTDSGKNWQRQISGVPHDLHAVYFVKADTGWAVGLRNKILKTSNGGQTWQPQHTEGLFHFSDDVHFLNSTTGIAVGKYGGNGEVLRTTNGGQNWTSMLTDAILLKSVHFVDNQRGWAVGVGGTRISITGRDLPSEDLVVIVDNPRSIILRTTNGGVTWTSIRFATTEWLRGVFFADLNSGWAVGDNGRILKTTDGGVSWRNQASGTTATLYAVDFINALTGLAVGKNGIILKTFDGGASWVVEASGTNVLLYSVDFVNETTAWAVGAGGTILQASPFTVSVEEKHQSDSTPKQFVLEQNYPNPFNPSTTIGFSLPRSSLVTLKIYNVNGEEVAILLAKQLPAGRHQMQWNASNLASGVYFYRLQTDDFVATRKLILLR